MNLFSIFKPKPWGDPIAYAPVEMKALSALPEPVMPGKGVPKGQQTIPSYLTTAKPSASTPLLRSDRGLANKNILDYRFGNDTRQIVRDFSRVDPNLSAAVASHLRTGITDNYIGVARNLDGTVNPEGTAAFQQLITRLNVLNDYTIGYDDGRSIRSLSEAWGRNLINTGAMCGEVVLDKTRLPTKFNPIATEQIKLYPSSDAKKLCPHQVLGGQDINLDVPTFFMVTLDEDLLDPYPISPLEPAIQGVLFGAEFLNDLRRIVKRTIHPRLTVTLDEEKFRKNIPIDIQNDANGVANLMNNIVDGINQKLATLQTEDAIVFFDAITVSIMDHGNTNLANEYAAIESISNARIAAGAKVMPTVLGQGDGTSNTASAETLIFMKLVNGTVTKKLDEMFSKMFTLSLRLMGYDVYAEFRFDEIALKPDSELESFKQMKQSRILGLLSLGLITDEEASIKLTGQLPPAGFKPLSGTNFFPGVTAQPAGDGYNGASNGGSALNQALKPVTPTKPAGGAGKPKAEIINLV